MSTRFVFPVSTPEAQGLSSRAILNFIDRVEEQHIAVNSLIVMRGGHVVAEGYWAPFGLGKPHRLFSAAKAISMCSILFLIQEGGVTLDTKMTDVFPDEMPEEISPFLAKLELRHLLSMTTGHKEDTMRAMFAPGANRVKTFFAMPLCYAPGTHFLYNNGVPDILQYLLQKITGEDIFDYLKPRLFDPLHMSGYKADRKEGNMVELPTMAFETRDLFKLAFLLSRNGLWEGKQLLREDLVREATRYQVPSMDAGVAGDHSAGYCWQMWRNLVGGYRIDGGQGQFGVVIPEADLVVGINSAESHQDTILQVLWEEIETKLYAAPLEEDPEAYAALQARLQALTWAPKQLAEPAPGWQGTYTLESPLLDRTVLSFELAGDALRLTADGSTVTAALNGSWAPGRVPFLVSELQKAAPGGMGLRHDLVGGADPTACVAAAGWSAPDTLDLHFRSEGWMSYHTFRFVFCGDKVTVSWLNGMDYNLAGRDAHYLPPVTHGRPVSAPTVVFGTKN